MILLTQVHLNTEIVPFFPSLYCNHLALVSLQEKRCTVTDLSDLLFITTLATPRYVVIIFRSYWWQRDPEQKPSQSTNCWFKWMQSWFEGREEFRPVLLTFPRTTKGCCCCSLVIHLIMIVSVHWNGIGIGEFLIDIPKRMLLVALW